MKTIREFIEAGNIEGKLVRAVIRQVGGWECFKELAEDVTCHGAGGGFPGFIYYCDTLEFTRRNKAEILGMAKEYCFGIGEDNIFTLISSFNCLDLTPEEVAEAIYNAKSEDRTNVFNALAWFALEEVCRSYYDIIHEH